MPVTFVEEDTIAEAADCDRTSEYLNPRTYHDRFGSHHDPTGGSALEFERIGTTRVYSLHNGKIVQGGAEGVKPFYSSVRQDTKIAIVNCARRTGAPTVEVRFACYGPDVVRPRLPAAQPQQK